MTAKLEGWCEALEALWPLGAEKPLKFVGRDIVRTSRLARSDPRVGDGRYGHAVQNRLQCPWLPLPVGHRLLIHDDG